MFKKEYKPSGFIPCNRADQGPDTMTDWLIAVSWIMVVVSGVRDQLFE
jgi:hypothetical protein